MENRDRLMVFIGEEYGIFYASEYSLPLGRRVRNPTPGAAKSLEELMQRLDEQSPGV